MKTIKNNRVVRKYDILIINDKNALLDQLKKKCVMLRLTNY